MLAGNGVLFKSLLLGAFGWSAIVWSRPVSGRHRALDAAIALVIAPDAGAAREIRTCSPTGSPACFRSPPWPTA